MRESPNINHEESSYKSLLIIPLIYFNPGLSQSLFRDVFTVSIVQTWDELMPYEVLWDLVCVKWPSSQKVITSCLVMGFSSGYPGEQRVWWPRQFSEGHSSRALHKDGCPQSGVQKRTAGPLHTIWVTMCCVTFFSLPRATSTSRCLSTEAPCQPGRSPTELAFTVTETSVLGSSVVLIQVPNLYS